MKRTGRKKEWSITFFCLGLILLSPPLLSILNNSGFILGIPAAYFLLFCLWGLMIFSIAFGVWRRKGLDKDQKSSEDIF